MQVVIIIGMFLVPVIFMALFGNDLSSALKIPLFIAWYAAVIIGYFYILSRAKGRHRDTITDIRGLKGDFIIKKMWHYVTAMYIFFFAIALLINKYYLIAMASLLPAAAIIIYGNYRIVRFRIDENRNFYVIRYGEEKLIDFNSMQMAEVKMHKHHTEPGVYRPEIKFYFNQPQNDDYIRLKIPIVTSVEYKTMVAPVLVIDFILAKCESSGFNIIYGGKDNLDWTAKRI